MSFYRNSAVLVLVILVDVYPVAQGIHGDAGGMAEMITILQPAHDDAGEDVAGAWELNGDFFIGQEEILFCKMIETNHGMLTLYDARGDEHGVGTDGSQFIYQIIGFLLRDSLFLVFRIRQQASFGIVGKTEMRYAQHLLHASHGTLTGSTIELAVIAHHGIHIDVGAQRSLFSAIACHQLSLTLRSHETRGDGI